MSSVIYVKAFFTKKQRQFINLIISTPVKPYEVAYYADKLSISPRYLANLCKDVSGKSTKEWIDEYVMNDYASSGNTPQTDAFGATTAVEP